MTNPTVKLSKNKCKHNVMISFRSPKGFYYYECNDCEYTISEHKFIYDAECSMPLNVEGIALYVVSMN